MFINIDKFFKFYQPKCFHNGSDKFISHLMNVACRIIDFLTLLFFKSKQDIILKSVIILLYYKFKMAHVYFGI